MKAIDGENIFANKTNKRLISKIQKQLMKLNMYKKANLILKMGGIYKCLMSLLFNIPHVVFTCIFLNN